jgi:hypothetical protein
MYSSDKYLPFPMVHSIPKYSWLCGNSVVSLNRADLREFLIAFSLLRLL